LLLWDEEDDLSLLNVSGSMDSSIVSSIVSDFKFAKLRSAISQPLEHSVKPLFLRMIIGDASVLLEFLLSLLEIMKNIFIRRFNLKSLLQSFQG
jgi:hypothetical protein